MPVQKRQQTGRVSMKRRESFRNAGSNRRDRSVWEFRCWLFDLLLASGTVPAPASFLGFHWLAPAGLLVIPIQSRIDSRRNCRSILWVFVVQVTSRPLLVVSLPLPCRSCTFQPSPVFRLPSAAFRSGPTSACVPGSMLFTKCVSAGYKCHVSFIILAILRKCFTK